MRTLSRKARVVLRLLSDVAQPRRGLDLVHASDGVLKRGTVYVTLARMEEDGFIESRLAGDGIRRLYRLTDLGRRLVENREG